MIRENDTTKFLKKKWSGWEWVGQRSRHWDSCRRRDGQSMKHQFRNVLKRRWNLKQSLDRTWVEKITFMLLTIIVFFIHWSLSILLKQMKRYIDGKIVAHEKQKKDGANPIAFRKKSLAILNQTLESTVNWCNSDHFCFLWLRNRF